MVTLEEKYLHLQEHLHSLNSVLVAFSGGVDSTLLLKVAYDVLGDRAIAATADSETYPHEELAQAQELAAWIGCQHIVVQTNELQDEAYASNQPDRCYHCKKTLFTELEPLAQQLGLSVIVYGAMADDVGTHRPGHQAAAEFQIRSPLIETDIGKTEIRELARRLQLPNWNKPSYACLSSRIAYGERVTADKLHTLDDAERFLRGLGFTQFRVRHHDTIARIEVPLDMIQRVVEHRETIVHHLKELGYTYVTLDLQGFRSGSMNEAPQSQDIMLIV
ncbi:MAG: ATP-dependent sacrificial sulfur transferase LarE [Chloroflexi bacterium AL-W]|nr:ATP-dependent sacrificial sulfur transferase LarE [Chloroflexi bacterium AL-N1]NOK66911.1 ATP-dependent sacrificial sulfur transferase LarE [Chloroflexi bacterium AL-N10]NOK74797.1 ATP-dependent sacrificial sulfur transferase LarE [Chloroflexi bacterium AL-N5]NOK81513.1 ATP-dependent sacrificial sulfur transferase LarE [Chloroflexi bacterium AL-W]NOK88983.1 ATP-dependent sacrificial sulfur transferase LarE [Chloroflexi bacterium AL-N15]